MVGIEDRRAVFITYQSLRATEPVTYDVYPYGLTYHRGSLYLVGRNPQHDEIRHWKVDRDREGRAGRAPLPTGRTDFDLQRHLARSFGIFHGDGDSRSRFRVRFSPTVARYVQESHVARQPEADEGKDGSLLAEFDLDDTEEIKRWIMSFGRHAEVLEPEDLRTAILNEIQALATVYGHPTPHRRKAIAQEESGHE